MKKLLSLVLSLILAMGLSMGAAAATEILGSDDFVPILDAKGKTVSKTVRDGRNTYRIIGIHYPEESKKELTYVNRARREAGLAPLQWEPKLEQAAIQRALEQYVLRSHDRPDGSEWHTVDSYANGENLAGSGSAYMDAEMVTEGWLNSPDHYENIMGTGEISQYFVSMAAACVETDRGIYWVQLFHADKAAASKNTNKEETSSTSKDSTPKASGTVTAKSIATDLGKAKVSGSNVALTVKGIDRLEFPVIKAAADWSAKNKKNVRLTVPTPTSNGKSTQGVLTMDPAKFTQLKDKSGIQTGVYVEKSSVKAVADNFTKKYPKANFSVIWLAQNGSYGGSVSIGAKVDLSKLNTKALLFYSYDTKTGKLTKLDLGKAGYSIDKNNYLKFAVTKGGCIVVTDKAF